MAANVQALCTSFKVEQMLGIHALGTTVTRGATTPDTIKAALYFAGTGLGSATTVYNSTGEISSAGYSAGGLVVTNGTAPTSSGTTAFWTPSAALAWTGLTTASPVDCILLYNSSQGNRAIAVLTFPQQTFSTSNFTYTFPANTSTTAQYQFT